MVIDEAHCIDRWGDDFRPNYSRLGAAKGLLGSPPVLAFTATAGIKTQRRILESLAMPDARVVVSGVNRPNVALLRLPIDTDWLRYQGIKRLCEAITQGHTMIFVPTVKIGQRVQEGLELLGLSIPFYHSKCGSANERDMLLGRFTGRISPPVPRIICTNAFGMGLDVPDVRLVIHWQHPPSVEDYLQEFGRAGRDGKQSLAVLFTSEANEDVKLLRFMAEMTVEEAGLQGTEKETVLKGKLSQIDDIHALATTRNACFRKGIIRYFEEERPVRRKPFCLRIVEWLFVKKTLTSETKHCCDKCNSLTKDNYADWVTSIFTPHDTQSSGPAPY